MDIAWVIGALLLAAFGGWPVTAVVLKFAGTVDATRGTPESASGTPVEAGTPESASGTPGEAETPEVAGTSESASGAGGNTPGTGPAGVEPGPRISPDAAGNILRGGLLIGILERLGVALAIMLDQSVAIAYIVAVKGLGRYPELKETPAVSERFIIGTLTSLLWAVIISVPVRMSVL